MRSKAIFGFITSLALAACASTHGQTASVQNLVKETSTMTTSAIHGSAGQGGAPLHPKLTAEQVMTRLLELIRSSRYVSEFTPERLNKAMGVEFVTYRPGYYAFGEQVTPAWWYSLEMDASKDDSSQFTLRFTPEDTENADRVAMTDVCEFDFDRLSAQLVSMGFSKNPYYVKGGRLLNYTFDRMRNEILEMRVDVYPQGEYVLDEQAGNSRVCVKMLYIL